MLVNMFVVFTTTEGQQVLALHNTIFITYWIGCILAQSLTNEDQVRLIIPITSKYVPRGVQDLYLMLNAALGEVVDKTGQFNMIVMTKLDQMTTSFQNHVRDRITFNRKVFDDETVITSFGLDYEALAMNSNIIEFMKKCLSGEVTTAELVEMYPVVQNDRISFTGLLGALVLNIESSVNSDRPYTTTSKASEIPPDYMAYPEEDVSLATAKIVASASIKSEESGKTVTTVLGCDRKYGSERSGHRDSINLMDSQADHMRAVFDVGLVGVSTEERLIVSRVLSIIRERIPKPVFDRLTLDDLEEAIANEPLA